jgi:hypothetical protein
MDPYAVSIIVCYNNLKKYSVLLSLLFEFVGTQQARKADAVA